MTTSHQRHSVRGIGEDGGDRFLCFVCFRSKVTTVCSAIRCNLPLISTLYTFLTGVILNVLTERHMTWSSGIICKTRSPVDALTLKIMQVEEVFSTDIYWMFATESANTLSRSRKPSTSELSGSGCRCIAKMSYAAYMWSDLFCLGLLSVSLIKHTTYLKLSSWARNTECPDLQMTQPKNRK